MDEMRTLQDFRADAPVPDRARLAPGHRRLLDEAGRPGRRLRGGWWLAVAGAAAAVTTVATLVTLLPGAPEPSAPAAPAAPTGAPRADQFIHRETTWWSVRCGGMGSGGPFMEMLSLKLEPGPSEPCDLTKRSAHTEEAWNRYDGWSERPGTPTPPPQTATGARSNGAGTDSLAPRQADALVADLPDDPGAALRMIRERSVPSRVVSAPRLTQAQRDFEEIAEVWATATSVPREKSRLLFRIAGELDGARLTATAVPEAGKTFTALWVEGNHRDHSFERNTFRLLLDPETQEFEGVQLVAGMNYYIRGKKSGRPHVAKGTVLATGLRVTTEVVDTRGARS
ncbi:hypothetical protein ABZ508_09000 [Streptomyces lavendulocolor]|uniref:CU044_5270 family protein n=1 Tax=Streptomyces lavendulocolor TaxID=67316 RepID=A0ABV2W1T5_9ACTN